MTDAEKYEFGKADVYVFSNIPTARGSFGRQSLYKHVEVLSGDSGSVFTNLGSQGWLNALGDTIRNNSSLLHSPSDSVKGSNAIW